jgi:uncharacterized protein YgbK (DUF1537 family)
MKMGVVADDITGANDIGGLFAKGGYRVHIYPLAAFGPAALAADGEPDVLILDTNSRLDQPDVAYAKVREATRLLRAAGCPRLFNKTCSVFRGNIGAEFDAMLDELGAPFAVVVLGFPRNGRLTVDGVHYVHGLRLEDSPFRNDPIHPMTRSDLVGILAAQTRRRVGRLGHETVSRGPAALAGAIDEARAACDYLILDVADQAALGVIAAAVADEPVLAGSSALAEELPAVWGASTAASQAAMPPPDSCGILCAAGSLTPQTLAQIAHLRASGAPVIELDTRRLFERGDAAAEIGRAVDALAAELAEGRDALVHAANSAEAVAATRAAGAAAGLSPTEVARRVTASLADVVEQVLGRNGGRRLVVAGGETSAAICERLRVAGMAVLDEIQPGVPACVTLGPAPLLLVLKSGSFGAAEFIERAVEYLRRH